MVIKVFLTKKEGKPYLYLARGKEKEENVISQNRTFSDIQ